MPTDGYRSLMLQTGHFRVISDFANSTEIPVTPARLVCHLIDKVKINVEEPTPDIAQAIRFANWLPRDPNKKSRFEAVTIPKAYMEALEEVVETIKDDVDRYYYEEPKYRPEPGFSFCAGIWLMLAVEKLRPGYLGSWMRRHKNYPKFHSEMKKLAVEQAIH